MNNKELAEVLKSVVKAYENALAQISNGEVSPDSCMGYLEDQEMSLGICWYIETVIQPDWDVYDVMYIALGGIYRWDYPHGTLKQIKHALKVRIRWMHIFIKTNE